MVRLPPGQDVVDDHLANAGCQLMTGHGTDQAAWGFPVDNPFVLVGQPELTLDFTVPGPDAS